MTAISPFSKSSKRSQAEKQQQLWSLYENNNDGPRRRPGNERQAISSFEIFSSPSLQKLRKKSCVHLDLNEQKRKNYKYDKNTSRNGRVPNLCG